MCYYSRFGQPCTWSARETRASPPRRSQKPGRSYRCRLMRRLMQRYFFLKADPRKFEMAPLEQFLPFIFPFYFSMNPTFSNVPKLVLIVKKQRKKLSTRELFYPFSRLSKGTVERIKFLFLAIARIQNQSDPRG